MDSDTSKSETVTQACIDIYIHIVLFLKALFALLIIHNLARGDIIYYLGISVTFKHSIKKG